MASIRARKDTGLLLIDFRYKGQRCREQTMLTDTPRNRERLAKLVERIERAMAREEFDYAKFFPDSPRAKSDLVTPTEGPFQAAPPNPGTATAGRDVPTFAEFAEVWFNESAVRWRKQYKNSIRDTLDKLFIKAFGPMRLDEIGRAEVLGFRAEIAKRPGRGGGTLSAKRINKLIAQLKAILNEGSDRYGLDSPARSIKPLKQKRTEVYPFTLEEANRIIATVRKDYQPYLTVRFLTGLRTGEANGLQWDDIDFAAGTIHITRTVSREGDGDTKTEGSKRHIPMVPQVRAALEEQSKRAMKDCPWVFHTVNGHPVDAVNFTNRVWYPLLRHLGMKQRPPYQMRHTAATLMLASGENPEWVARMLGHTTTEMLFRVYSRYVPNLTRNDGRAYTKLLYAQGAGDAATPDKNGSVGLVTGLSEDQKRALFAALANELGSPIQEDQALTETHSSAGSPVADGQELGCVQ